MRLRLRAALRAFASFAAGAVLELRRDLQRVPAVDPDLLELVSLAELDIVAIMS
jgi:hypothetical protein